MQGGTRGAPGENQAGPSSHPHDGKRGLGRPRHQIHIPGSSVPKSRAAQGGDPAILSCPCAMGSPQPFSPASVTPSCPPAVPPAVPSRPTCGWRCGCCCGPCPGTSPGAGQSARPRCCGCSWGTRTPCSSTGCTPARRCPRPAGPRSLRGERAQGLPWDPPSALGGSGAVRASPQPQGS